MSVDVGLMLALAVADDASTRSAFRESLMELAPEGAVTGVTGFDPESQTVRRWIRVLTITKDAIEPIDRPEPEEPEEETDGTALPAPE